MIGRVLLSLAGAGFAVAGFHAKVENDNLLRAVAADPVCTHALTLATSPRSGRTCSVEAATTVRFVELAASRGDTYDEVELGTARGSDEDIELNGFSRGFYRRASPGSRATVEHIAGGAAFVADPGGTASSVENPETRSLRGPFFAIAGSFAVIALLAAIVRT